MIASVARRMQKRISRGDDRWDAFLDCQSHMVNLAKAAVELHVLKSFQKHVAAQTDPSIQGVLATLRDIYALSCIRNDIGWFQEAGLLETNKARAIRKLLRKLYGELRPNAVALVDGFGIPDHCIAAPIATTPS